MSACLIGLWFELGSEVEVTLYLGPWSWRKAWRRGSRRKTLGLGVTLLAWRRVRLDLDLNSWVAGIAWGRGWSAYLGPLNLQVEPAG